MKDIIQKAVDGGLDEATSEYLYGLVKRFDNKIKDSFVYSEFWYVVLSRDFLRAFFGEFKICDSDCNGFDCKDKGWQYHAQQLVLAEYRIEYLRRFI